jgi:hypothetical protein
MLRLLLPMEIIDIFGQASASVCLIIIIIIIGIRNNFTRTIFSPMNKYG